MSFDPNSASLPGSGIFGLPFSESEARVIVLPVPFDATTSYGHGCARGPQAILEASKQVDLFDVEVGRPYEAGIAMASYSRAESARLAVWNREARRLARPVLKAGGEVAGNPRLERAVARVNALSEKLNALVHARARDLLAQGKIVAVVGGDHATPFGSIQAHAEAFPGLGVLHIDAHADLRHAYEGFTFSHASIMYNVMQRLPGVSRLVQVGIRDLCEEEHAFARASRGRVVMHLDALLARERFRGATWASQCAAIVKALPREVYVSFDIDGLDPSLCPSTGTPVPGGLSFHQASALLGAVVESGRRIVGFDLTEVTPGQNEWDANVGARVLYKLIGWTLLSQEPKQRSKSRPRKR